MVPMRDGVRLATDVYRPAIDGEPIAEPAPVILQRTIYDKSNPTFAGPAEYLCKRGYVAVVQDCRGRFSSEGEYYHMANEALDGYDAVEWLAAQRWSDGQTGTFGTSYGAQVQSALATQAPPHLSAMIVVEGPSNIYEYGLRHDGAFQLKFLTAGFWLGADSKEAAADPKIARAMENASDRLGTLPPERGKSPLAMVPSYERWVFDFMTRGDHEAFWDNPSFNIEAHYDQHSDVPTYLVGGWYDSWSRAMVTHFVGLSRRKRGPVKLLMGPWTHNDVSVSITYSGEVDFGPGSALDGNLADDFNAWRLRWFDRWLKRWITAWMASRPSACSSWAAAVRARMRLAGWSTAAAGVMSASGHSLERGLPATTFAKGEPSASTHPTAARPLRDTASTPATRCRRSAATCRGW